MARPKTTELDDFEPWVPRPRQVILAELREISEKYCSPEDLAWWKENFPKIWSGADERGQLEMW